MCELSKINKKGMTTKLIVYKASVTVTVMPVARFFHRTAEPHSAAFSRAPQAHLPQGFVMWNAFQRVENVDRCTTTQKKSTLWQGLDVLYCCH